MGPKSDMNLIHQSQIGAIKETSARAKARDTFHYYIAEYQRTKTQTDNFAEGTQYYYFIAEFLIFINILASAFDIFKNPDGQAPEDWEAKLSASPDIYGAGSGYFSFYKLYARFMGIMCLGVLIQILILAAMISDEGSRVRDKSLPFQYVEVARGRG